VCDKKRATYHKHHADNEKDETLSLLFSLLLVCRFLFGAKGLCLSHTVDCLHQHEDGRTVSLYCIHGGTAEVQSEYNLQVRRLHRSSKLWYATKTFSDQVLWIRHNHVGIWDGVAREIICVWSAKRRIVVNGFSFEGFLDCVVSQYDPVRRKSSIGQGYIVAMFVAESHEICFMG
jgi:hypothetical protein